MFTTSRAARITAQQGASEPARNARFALRCLRLPQQPISQAPHRDEPARVRGSASIFPAGGACVPSACFIADVFVVPRRQAQAVQRDDAAPVFVQPGKQRVSFAVSVFSSPFPSRCRAISTVTLPRDILSGEEGSVMA
jgi:hypothetical protein